MGCIGDVIHQVNGISGDSTLMLEKLKEKSVMLVLKHDDPQCIVPPAGKEVVEDVNDPAAPAEAFIESTQQEHDPQCIVSPAGKEVGEQVNDPAAPAEALAPITTAVEADERVG